MVAVTPQIKPNPSKQKNPAMRDLYKTYKYNYQLLFKSQPSNSLATAVKKDAPKLPSTIR